MANQNHTGGGPNSGKTMGFRAHLTDGTTKRFDSKAKAIDAAGGDKSRVRRIVKNHNHTTTEQPV